MTDENVPQADGDSAAPSAVLALSPPTPPLRPIDVIRQRSKLARRPIDVPEWGLVLWFGKLTVADMESVGAKEATTKLERNLHLLIQKSELENGDPAFGTGDLHFLKTEADFVVIQRLLDFMFASAAGLPTIEEEAERIAANPPSASA